MKAIRDIGIFVALGALVLAGAPSARAATPAWPSIFSGNVVAVTTLAPAVSGNPQAVIASRFGTNAGTYRSLDGGVSWELIDANPAFSLAADPAAPGSFYSATYAGLFKFADWGASTPVSLNPAIRYSIAVSPFDPQRLYGDNFRSFNGGATWLQMALPAFNGGTPSSVSDNLPHLKVSTDQLMPLFLLATCDNRQSFRSTDGGSTWTAMFDMIDTVAIDPTDARYYYLGSCTSSSYRCTPTGPCLSLGLNPHIHDIVANPEAPNRVFAVTTSSGIRFSNDRGATWLVNATLGTSLVREGKIHFDAVTGLIYVPTDVGLLVKSDFCTDLDADGFGTDGGQCGAVDCDDNAAGVNPTKYEQCQDGVDNDCNGAADFSDLFCINNCSDSDGDGFLPSTPSNCGGSDCNDANAATYPGAPETKSDGIDQDCNGYDLTITVTKALYTRRTDTLTVEAKSALGQSASLQVVNFGPLTWSAKRSVWTASFKPAGGNPGQITVSGLEGSETATVTAK